VPCEQRRVWVVRRDRLKILVPILCEEVAALYRKAGWQVTELPLSAFSEEEMRCLGVSGSGPCGEPLLSR
jgi:hypothetical protein